MKHKIQNYLTAGLGMIVLIAGAHSASAADAPVTGQLASLAQLAANTDTEGELPAKLCGLLWPNSGSNKLPVKKFSMPAGGEERLFCVRTGNQDIVIVHSTQTKPDEDTRNRREIYYRTTARGDLVLALSVAFEFTIDDVGNELLKKAVYKTYGEISGDGSKPFPITADMQAKFEAEKKFWLGQEKKLRKKWRKAD